MIILNLVNTFEQESMYVNGRLDTTYYSTFRTVEVIVSWIFANNYIVDTLFNIFRHVIGMLQVKTM